MSAGHARMSAPPWPFLARSCVTAGSIRNRTAPAPGPAGCPASRALPPDSADLRDCVAFGLTLGHVRSSGRISPSRELLTYPGAGLWAGDLPPPEGAPQVHQRHPPGAAWTSALPIRQARQGWPGPRNSAGVAVFIAGTSTHGRGWPFPQAGGAPEDQPAGRRWPAGCFDGGNCPAHRRSRAIH